MHGVIRRDSGPSPIVDFYAFAATSLLYGAYTMIFAKSTYILLCKRMSSMTLVLLGATILMYTVCTMHWACFSILTWEELSSTTVTSNARSQDFVLVVVKDLFLINVFLGDAIVTWRAWLILDRKRRVLILPGFFLLTSLAFGLIHVTSGDANRDRLVGGLQTVLSGCDPLFCLLTTATNASSTLMIAWKTWKHRKDVRRYLNSGTRKTQVGKVLVLLLESGSIYCVITAICGISFWVNAAMNNILKSLLIQVTGLYPTVIIVFAALQMTHYDQTVGEATSMAFASPSLSATTGSSSPHDMFLTTSSASDTCNGSGIMKHEKMEDRENTV